MTPPLRQKSFFPSIALGLVVLATAFTTSGAQFPTPSVYPTSWQLDLDYDRPQRIIIEVPGESAPRAFWYMTYSVQNRTDREQQFLPVFEMLTDDGKIVRSDNNVPALVFHRIKEREKKTLLEPFTKIAGPLLVGEDQARDGVAIWPEVTPRMGYFSVFVDGLSGETARVRVGESDIILRRQLQLNFHIRGLV